MSIKYSFFKCQADKVEWTAWPLNIGQDFFPQNVCNYQMTLRNIPKKQIYNTQCNGSPKSLNAQVYLLLLSCWLL